MDGWNFWRESPIGCRRSSPRKLTPSFQTFLLSKLSKKMWGKYFENIFENKVYLGHCWSSCVRAFSFQTPAFCKGVFFVVLVIINWRVFLSWSSFIKYKPFIPLSLIFVKIKRKPKFNANGFQNIWLRIKPRQIWSWWNGSKWWKTKSGETNLARVNMLCDAFSQPFTTYSRILSGSSYKSFLHNSIFIPIKRNDFLKMNSACWGSNIWISIGISCIWGRGGVGVV